MRISTTAYQEKIPAGYDISPPGYLADLLSGRLSKGESNIPGKAQLG